MCIRDSLEGIQKDLADEQARLEAARAATTAYVAQLKELYTKQIQYIGSLSSLTAETAQPQACLLYTSCQTAFLRHATSKLRTAQDLAAIGTLGFRGEALAAIAAVSRVELFTRTAQCDLGTSLTLEGGQVLSQAVSYTHLGSGRGGHLPDRLSQMPDQRAGL